MRHYLKKTIYIIKYYYNGIISDMESVYASKEMFKEKHMEKGIIINEFELEIEQNK